MTAEPALRIAGPEDAGRLAPLYAAFYVEDGMVPPAAGFEANLRRMLGDPRAGLIVAEADGRILGFASITLGFGIEFGWSAELEDLFVRPEDRGRGLARRLVEEAARLARSRGATEIWLVITPEGEATHGLSAFYARRGFAATGRILMSRTLGA